MVLQYVSNITHLEELHVRKEMQIEVGAMVRGDQMIKCKQVLREMMENWIQINLEGKTMFELARSN